MTDDSPSNGNGSNSTNSNSAAEAAPQGFGLYDSSWSDEQWHELLISLVEQDISSWRELAARILGHLNPSQVGTSLASSDGFKRRYGKGNTMRIVMDWAYNQTGRCEDCGSRLELQADHKRGRQKFDDPLDADFIENMTLRCRRCNVIRRPSHDYGGQTYLTAEASLMWILLVIRPRTLFDFTRLCRIYGMTMADIRMQEAWAMAHWLSSSDPPLFHIEDDEYTSYDLLRWSSGAITRTDTGAAIPDGSVRLYGDVRGNKRLAYIAIDSDGRKKLFVYPLCFIPFSTYDLSTMPLDALAVRYIPPDRKKGTPQRIVPLPPVGMGVISALVVGPDEQIALQRTDGPPSMELIPAPTAGHNGRLLPAKLQELDLQIVALAV